MSRDNPSASLTPPPHVPASSRSSSKTPPPPPPSATPSRQQQQRNNYANDETTPIASAKRPAGSKRRTPMSATATTTPRKEEELSPMHCVRAVPRGSHLGATAANSTNAVSANYKYRAADLEVKASEESELSVLTEQQENNHSIGGVNANSWVGRKVDALFSPVLSFLSGRDDSGRDNDNDDEAELANDESEAIVDEEQSIAVSAAIREALLEASKELQDDHGIHTNNNNDNNNTDLNCHSKQWQQHSSSEDDYDTVPVMTKTDSTKDADGDLTMAIPSLGLQHSGTSTQDEFDNHSDDESDYRGHALALQQQQQDSQYANEEEEEEEFNPFLFIKSLPPYQYAIPPNWSSRTKALPPLSRSSPPICLVLDLDETLVHCTVEPIQNADMVFPVEFNGMEYVVHVRCRPFLKEFLEKVSAEFEVVVFTASQQVYADKLLDKIDPEGKYIRHRLFRDSCLPVEGNFLKDLTILGRDLRRAVLVDNSPHAFGYQVDNGIPIESWFDDPEDRELLKLERFLRSLHGKEDVRDVVREKFQTYRLVLEA
ncbi:hypothetical protein ACHAXN_008909 [Cyclotella atomus]